MTFEVKFDLGGQNKNRTLPIPELMMGDVKSLGYWSDSAYCPAPEVFWGAEFDGECDFFLFWPISSCGMSRGRFLEVLIPNLVEFWITPPLEHAWGEGVAKGKRWLLILFWPISSCWMSTHRSVHRGKECEFFLFWPILSCGMSRGRFLEVLHADSKSC